ncbi:uncharacterized protein [Choristoneura fumiferana]|uniref:uncharacterized protein n=2 Tax=Choristoneura fumiferana TaxID=7141 RepID=UPI003D15A482
MFGKGKKSVSLAYKEKLLADIAYYEKRIQEAQHKKKCNSSEDVVSSDEDSNPYKVTVGPFPMQLKREEARLSDCASMTLELAMLTIMQSEVNVLAAAPEVRRPVSEDGTWLEVAAECKIDLVSFTITFYAHKPHRKFAPTRFRSLQVSLTKPAHQKELSQSVLAKLNRPNLALQVLQSYATAFRSRRTTLLELAEKYADRLKMEAMPEGGYRVNCLELLTVEWTLENMWSPVVPFCHRMKFEVEYMPKHYIHAIGKLYKQFKDPSLETSERTLVLSKIFDICLEAQGPAKDLQDTFESDPETAGRLHERRTTIDQELEVPSKCDQNVQMSPQKLPKDKENKSQNRKTTMAPPKTLPKKAKKVASVNNKGKEVLDDENVSKSSKSNEKVAHDDATKTGNDVNVTENRKAVKRAIESDATGNAKKIRTEEKNGVKPAEIVTENDKEASEVPSVSSKSNTRKKDSKAISKSARDTDVNSKNNKMVEATKSSDSKNINKRTEATAKNAAKKVGGDNNNVKPKEIETDVVTSKNEAKEIREVGSVASSKASGKKADANAGNHLASAKEQGTEGSVASSKKSRKGVDSKSVVSSKSENEKGNVKTGSSEVSNKKVNNNKNEVTSKNLTDTMSSGNSKNKNITEKDSNKYEKTKPEVAAKNKAIDEKKVQKDNEKEKQPKAITKDKVIVHKKSVDTKVTKQNETNEITDKSVKTKQSTDKPSKSSDKNKELLRDGMRNKVTNTKNTENKSNQNTKTVENNTQNVKKSKEGNKITEPSSEATKTAKNDINKKKATKVVEKSKTIVSKVSNANDNKNEATTSKANDRFEKVGNNKVVPKLSINNIKNQNKDKAEKPRNINAKTVPEITKSNILKTNIHTGNPNIQKIKENQAKVAEKLKTRIPMMKNKLKIGSFNDNLGKTDTKLGKNAEKTKIPFKSLPVFKKIVRNPTRMSPRKPPSTVKPSSHGFSIK